MTNSEQLKKDRELVDNWESYMGFEAYGHGQHFYSDDGAKKLGERQVVKNLLAAQERIKDAEKADAVEKEREKLEEAKDIIEGLAMQYGLELPGPLLHSGAISAMECAFEFLDWDDPFPIPERKCDVGTCIQPATCGKPTSDGYKKLCREHWNFFKQK